MLMLNVYDRVTRKKTAVLQNAFDIVETQEVNQIYSLTFTLPAEDEKNRYCLPRHFVRYGDTGELYRIKSPKVNENNTSTVTYECEHVITTLCDDIMFGSFVYGGRGVYTTATINWLLNQQKTKNWRLGTCAFSRQFEYNWEQENILNALYSIPKEFAANYIWTFDTTNYPWTLNLVEIDKTATPEYYLRAKSNILSSGSSADYANICTRIYPLGYGEGVNQLTIKDATVTNVVKSGNVNVNGIPSETSATKYGNTYIQSPQAYIDKYGIVEKVLVDRRFEQANSLFGYAKQMLEVYQEPTMSRSFDVTDLHQITSRPLDDARVGKICKMTQDGSIAYITRTQRRLDVAGDLQIDLSTKASDIASNVADLADRIRIESVYAQGATQLYQHSKDANAAAQKGKGMVLPLYFPSEMKQINKVLLKLELKRFRYYSDGTAMSTQKVQTTSVKQQETQTTTQQAEYTKTTTQQNQYTRTTTQQNQYTRTTTQQNQYTRTTTQQEQYSRTSSGGSANGQTSISTGGGGSGISLSPSITVEVTDTGDANWDQRPYTDGTELDVSISTQDSAHNHSVWGYTGEVTPPESENYKHDHAINFDTDQDTQSGEGGSHSHAASIVNPGGEDTHNHTLSYNSLKHNHPVSATVTVQVNNTQSGYSGFGHSHTFSVGSHTHSITIPSHDHSVTIPSHDHSVTIPKHDHSVTIPSHDHSVTIPKHDHTVTIPSHDHTVTIPAHDHSINPGIFEASVIPTKFDIYVGNTIQATVNARSFDGDITQWLLNSDNMVPRNSWINVEIVPDDLAYVQASVFVQGFVQSRGGGNY